jgi:hypothetical protein
MLVGSSLAHGNTPVALSISSSILLLADLGCGHQSETVRGVGRLCSQEVMISFSMQREAWLVV